MSYKIEVDENQSIQILEKIMKCKLIALNEMGKHPLMNIKFFNKTDKKNLFDKVKLLLDESEDTITKKFNDVCEDRLFFNGVDYSNYNVYIDKRFPEQQKKIDIEEPDLEKLKEDIKTNKLIENETETESEVFTIEL